MLVVLPVELHEDVAIEVLLVHGNLSAELGSGAIDSRSTRDRADATDFEDAGIAEVSATVSRLGLGATTGGQDGGASKSARKLHKVTTRNVEVLHGLLSLVKDVQKHAYHNRHGKS